MAGRRRASVFDLARNRQQVEVGWVGLTTQFAFCFLSVRRRLSVGHRSIAVHCKAESLSEIRLPRAVHAEGEASDLPRRNLHALDQHLDQ